MAFLGLCFQQGSVLLCLESRLGPDLDVGMKPDRTGPANTAHWREYFTALLSDLNVGRCL